MFIIYNFVYFLYCMKYKFISSASVKYNNLNEKLFDFFS